MAIACPVKTSKDWKDLSEKFGDNIAEGLFYRNEGKIPSLQEAQTMIRGGKVGQFKKAVRYLQSTTSANAADLVTNMFRIVHKVGNDLYVVKGSNINEKPKSGAEAEIHQANVKFLNSINESVGPLFNLTKIEEEAKTDSLSKDIINGLKEGSFEGLYAAAYKNEANNPKNHEQLLKELGEQALDPQSRPELENILGTSLVNKIAKYAEAGKKTIPEKEVLSPEAKDKKTVQDSIRANPKLFNNLTEDDNGNYVFFHYSNEDLSKSGIDPNKFGKNVNKTGREEAGRSVPVSMYYTDNTISEPGVGYNKHAVRIPQDQVYPFNSDPLNLYDQAEKNFKAVYPDRAFSPNEQIGWIGKLAAEKGYKMVVAEWKGKTLRAESTANLVPELIEEPLGGSYAANTVKTLTDEKFPLNKKRYKSKPLDPTKTAGGEAISGTYKVDINQDVLNNIVSNNADAQNKDVAVDQKESFDTNKSIMNDNAPKYSKEYGDIQVTNVNKNVLDNLQKKFNLPYEVVNDSTATWRGKFENGKIYINSAKVNDYTALHEYLHPFMGALQKDNPELYNNLLTDLQSTEEGKKAIEEIKKTYPEISGKDQLDEALVSHLSKMVDQDSIKAKPWYQGLIDWFKQLFAKTNLSISGLNLRMSLNDMADKIIDPTYSADLKSYYDLNDTVVKYQKDNPVQEYSDRLDQLIEKVKNNLTLDIKIQPKTKQEQTRKYFSAKTLKELEENKDSYKALAGYVQSSIANANKINDSFQDFKTFYEKSGKNLSQQDILKGMSVLGEIEQHAALYSEARFVVDAIRDANPDEYDDNFRVLQGRLNGDATMLNNYFEYGAKLQADWLYPGMKKTIDKHFKEGTLEKMPGYNEYLSAKAANPNIADRDAVEMGVKKWLRSQLSHAKVDMDTFNSYMSGALNSKDPISQLVAGAFKEQFSKNNDKLFRVKNGIKDAITKAFGKQIITTNKGHKEAYGKYLHQVDSWEKTGYDEKDNPKFEYVKRTAFHEQYRYDQFYKAKKELFKGLGIRPNKSDLAESKAWEGKKEAWFDQHTVRTYNDKGEVTSTVPHPRYINPEFAKVSSDPLFRELTKHYNDANTKLGQYQLKYGIVPQLHSEEGILSGTSVSKGVKGNLEAIKENVKGGLGAEESEYYAQDINGKEYKNIPIRHTKMIPEDRLSYNMGQSVADYWESASKYEAAKDLEPSVAVLKNFITGNANLKISARDVPITDAKGIKKLGNFIKGSAKVKDQANINRMLIDFMNDTVYGESEKKSGIKSPLWNLKYMVYKKGDVSANGKPHREYVYSLEDLKKKTGAENIEHSHFQRGTEKDVNGYGVTMINGDKTLSLNKTSRKLNALSSTITLGMNFFAGTSHLLRASASAFIEASGGKYFNLKELGSGYKKYIAGLTSFDFLEDARGGKGSLISQHLNHYGTFNGEFLNEYGKHIGQGVVNKLFRRSSLFFLIHGAEHMTQTTQMLAAMEHTKVSDGKGGQISLANAYELDDQGYRKLKDGVKWSEKQDSDFKNTLQYINKDRGNFSEFDKAGLQRLWYGKMLIMFRRHIYNGVQRRWGASNVNFERGDATAGYYRSFMLSLASEMNEYRLNGKFRKFSPDEAYAAKKTLADVGVFGLGMSLIAPAFHNLDKDKDKQGWNDYAAVFAKRLQMDQSFFYNPLEWKKIIQEPVVTGSTVGKLYNLFSQMATSPSEEYQKDGPGYHAGDSKLKVKAEKLIPGFSTLMSLHDPTDLMKFYGVQKPASAQ